jgi:hypothetical protein
VGTDVAVFVLELHSGAHDAPPRRAATATRALAAAPAARMSSFPIVPRAGGPDRAPPRAVALPALNLGKISFAAMGGSAELLHFPENDVAYDVDSSDDDLDGMEAAVEAFEARRRRTEEIAMARARAEDADERLAREKVETEQSLRQLRARRERFEAALAARGSVAETRRIGKSQGQIDVEDARSTAFAEAAALEALRQRRARIDARIAALLGERRPERKDAADDASSIARAARAAAAVDAEYVAPKWKQRRDRRLAEEEAAARRSAPDGGEGEKRDENEKAFPKNANGAVANENAIRAAFAAAARLTRRGDAEGLRSMLCTDPTRVFLNGRLDDHVRAVPSGDGRDATRLDENAGFTLLTLACGLGDWPSARCLLRHGADINAPDRFERAPVDAAVHEGHFDLADALVRWAKERGVRMGEQ